MTLNRETFRSIFWAMWQFVWASRMKCPKRFVWNLTPLNCCVCLASKWFLLDQWLIIQTKNNKLGNQSVSQIIFIMISQNQSYVEMYLIKHSNGLHQNLNLFIIRFLDELFKDDISRSSGRSNSNDTNVFWRIAFLL